MQTHYSIYLLSYLFMVYLTTLSVSQNNPLYCIKWYDGKGILNLKLFGRKRPWPTSKILSQHLFRATEGKNEGH
jgi:hypothetical protein